jgi:hypothetical protein
MHYPQQPAGVLLQNEILPVNNQVFQRWRCLKQLPADFLPEDPVPWKVAESWNQMVL